MKTKNAINSSHPAAPEGSGEVYQFPCSLAQQRFWLLDQVNPGDPCYNIALRWRLTGALDAKLAERAFNAIMERHEALRTVLVSVDGQPFQRVLSKVPITVPVVDLRPLPETKRQEEADRLSLQEALKGFDLAQAPLLRVTLLRLRDEEHIALVTAHHVVCDGWSMGILAKEFGEFYAAMSADRRPDLPELAVQYPDFAVWQQEWLESADLGPQAAYWKEKLAGLKPLELEGDFARPPVRTSHGSAATILLPKSLTDQLADFSRQHEVTLYTSSLAALKALLWLRTGQTDISLGTQVAGRDEVELEDLVGVFINTLLLRTEVSSELTFTDLLDRVQETITEAIVNQDLPFEQLVEMLRPKRDPSRTPLFSVNFIFQRSFIKDREFVGISLSETFAFSSGAIYDLNLFMVEHSDGWRVMCEYSTDLYRAQTIEGLLASFQQILQTVADNPQFRLDDLRSNDSRPARAALSRKNPRADIEAKLTQIWESVLSVRPIETTADFFELGGHSLLATRLLARIDKAFGKKLTLATLFQSSTIAQLATVLAGSNGAKSVPGLIGIQPKGGNLPIFCLHGVPSMALLAQELGPDQPFFAVHVPEDATLEQPYTVEQIAAVHVRTVRSYQPEGPYFLVGWCREGLLAYEVAQQLRAQGQEVAMVAMFDTWVPDYLARYSPREARHALRVLKFSRVRMRLQQMRQMGMRQSATYMPGVLGEAINDWLRHWKWRLAYRKELENNGSGTNAHRSQDEMLFFAVDNYRAQPYHGRVLLFRSDKYRTWKYWDRALGWAHLLPNLELHEIPGVHDSMLTGPHLPDIARAMADVAGNSARKSGPQLSRVG